jgi:hypothetical protein
MPIKSRLESTSRYLSFFFAALEDEDISKTFFFCLDENEAFLQKKRILSLLYRTKMAPHENVFYAEKHSNDSLHNPQRRGTDHTSKEIQIAARLLGRTSVISDEKTRKKMERENAIEKRKEKLLQNAKPLGDGFILVGSGDSIRRINVNEAMMKKENMKDEYGRQKRKFDSDSRWKTEERIKNGGTAGQNELVVARNAASELEEKKKMKKKDQGRRREESLPVLVPPSELIFGSDGFVKESTDDDEDDEEEAMKMIAIERRRARSEKSKLDVKSTARKAKNIRKFIGL